MGRNASAGKLEIARLWFAVILVLFAGTAQSKDTPPPGYEWRFCKTVECSFLVPDGWTFEQLEAKGVLKYQITKSRRSEKLTPKVRISILRDSESRTGMTVERHLQLFIQDLQRSARILETWNSKSGALTSRAAMSLHYSKVSEPVKQFSLLVANGKTGTLYVFSFEALPEVWEREWAVVEQLFSHLRLDDKI